MTVIQYPGSNNILGKLVNTIRSVIDLSSTILDLNSTCSFFWLFVVGEEDELSIKEAAELVVEGMQFTGKVEVSSVNWIFKGLLYVGGGEGGGLVHKMIKGHFKRSSSMHRQATVVTDSNSWLISLQPDSLDKCEWMKLSKSVSVQDYVKINQRSQW